MNQIYYIRGTKEFVKDSGIETKFCLLFSPVSISDNYFLLNLLSSVARVSCSVEN